MGRGNAVACCCSVFLPRQCLLKAGCIRLVHNGSKVGPTPPQGSGLLSAAATGSLIERWQLGCQGLLPGPRLRGGSGTWWGEGGCRTHSGRLCLWVTANSGFHMMPKLPGLWVQIRNVKPCCGPHWFWLKCLGGEYSFLRVVSGSHLSNGQALAQSGQATGSLDRTKQDVGLHTTQVFCPPGPHPSSQKCSDHEPSAGGRGRGERPQKLPPALQGPPPASCGLALLAMSLRVCLPTSRLQGRSEQDRAWGSCTSAGRGCGALGAHSVAGARRRQAKLKKATSLEGSHQHETVSSCPASTPQIKNTHSTAGVAPWLSFNL